MKKLIAALMLCFIAALVPSCIPFEPEVDIQAINNAYHTGYSQGWINGRDAAAQCCDVCILYPTREQVITFLVSDNTSEIPYDSKSFICTDFAEMINHNAWAAGIPCYAAWITFENIQVGHAIVAFPVCENNTVILLYNDPETGDLLYPESVMTVGQPYPVPVCGGSVCNFKTIGKIRTYK